MEVINAFTKPVFGKFIRIILTFEIKLIGLGIVR